MKDCFSTYHPSLNFLFFTFVIGATVFVLHPVLLGGSFLCALAYSFYLRGSKAIKFSLFLLPFMVAAALVNTAFNHAGMTILTYVNNNPITLESIYYGVAASVMLGSVMLWFSCYNEVMTADKFMYLFGKAIPSLSLVISMVLRFVPLYTEQIKKITAAQRCIGRDVSSGRWYHRAKSGMMILSAMISWALENGVETADSMKSRGYGLRGRTAYSNYRFDARDQALLMIMALLLAFLLGAMFTGRISVQYFPSYHTNDVGVVTILLYAAFMAVCGLPLLLNLKEDSVWRYLRSKI